MLLFGSLARGDTATPGDIDLIKLSDWHEAQHYVGRWPCNQYDDTYLRRHASAAIRIATFCADQCRHLGLDADLMRRFDGRLGNCRAALDSALRIEPEPPAPHDPGDRM